MDNDLLKEKAAGAARAAALTTLDRTHSQSND